MEKRLAQLAQGNDPFSFIYNGVSSKGFLGAWARRAEYVHSDGRLRKTVTLSDAATGLVVTCELTFFQEYPAVEWIVFFENSGTKDTPIVEDVQAMDLSLDSPLPRPGAGGPATRSADAPFVLQQTNGAFTIPEDLIMHEVPLGGNERHTLGGGLGMPSAFDLPYFRVDMRGASVILAVGWSGQWKADFQCVAGESLRVTAGIEKTHFRLHPGERVRSPRMLMLWWEGEPWQSNVQFRRLLYEQYVPAFRGEKTKPFVIFDSYDVVGLDEATEANQLPLVSLANRLGVEVFLTDAGWFEGGFPAGAGNWRRIRKDCYPNGLGPLAKACQDNGMIYGLWFDSERVIAGTEIALEHPEWLLWKKGACRAVNVAHVYSDRWQGELAKLGFTKLRGRTPDAFLYHRENVQEYHGDDQTAMLNFGLPEVQEYFFRVVDDLMRLPGFQSYRHDMNVTAPLPYFQSNDEPDRMGITEMKYFEGLYACWDRIIAANPDCFINTDHRLDLECVMRTHVIQMSDQGGNNLIDQSSLYSISQYIPNGCIMSWSARVDADDYTFFSNLPSSPLLRFALKSLQSESGFQRARRRIDQYLAIRRLLNGDWYPLTANSRSTAEWMGSQYHRRDLGEGMLLVYRRDDCVQESLIVKPQFLERQAEYRVASLTSGNTETVSGASLLNGYEVVIRNKPAADVILYGSERSP